MVRKTIVVVALLSIASMASAVSLPMGHVYLKVQDFTHLYDQGRPLTDAQMADPMNWVGKEIRSIYNVYSAGYVDSTGVFHETWTPTPAEELTGVLHNAMVRSVTITPNPNPPFGFDITVLCSALAPPPPPVDTDFLGTPPIAIPPAGARVTLWADSSPDYTNDPDGPGGLPGPAQWAGADPLNRLMYPTVTDGTLFMDGTMPEMMLYYNGFGPADIKYVTLNTNTKKGQGEYFVNSIDPLAQENVASGLIKEDWAGQQPQWHTVAGQPLYGDAHGLTNLTYGNPQAWAGWWFMSQDPVEYYRIPEPSTCALLGGALLGLLRRRKRK